MTLSILINLKQDSDQIIYEINFLDPAYKTSGILNMIGTTLLERLRFQFQRIYPRSREITKEAADDLYVATLPDKGQIRVTIRDSIIKYLEVGTHAHQLTHLVNKVVPIRTPTGVIFRKVTPKALAEGKWVVQGIAPHFYVANFIRDNLAFLAGVSSDRISIQYNIPQKYLDKTRGEGIKNVG
jgi:hypothetical protein